MCVHVQCTSKGVPTPSEQTAHICGDKLLGISVVEFCSIINTNSKKGKPYQSLFGHVIHTSSRGFIYFGVWAIVQSQLLRERRLTGTHTPLNVPLQQSPFGRERTGERKRVACLKIKLGSRALTL